jgi:hypothetical protein
MEDTYGRTAKSFVPLNEKRQGFNFRRGGFFREGSQNTIGQGRKPLGALAQEPHPPRNEVFEQPGAFTKSRG